MTDRFRLAHTFACAHVDEQKGVLRCLYKKPVLVCPWNIEGLSC